MALNPALNTSRAGTNNYSSPTDVDEDVVSFDNEDDGDVSCSTPASFDATSQRSVLLAKNRLGRKQRCERLRNLSPDSSHEDEVTRSAQRSRHEDIIASGSPELGAEQYNAIRRQKVVRRKRNSRTHVLRTHRESATPARAIPSTPDQSGVIKSEPRSREASFMSLSDRSGATKNEHQSSETSRESYAVQRTTTVCVQGNILDLMCQTVGTDAWTGEGSEWATKLVIKDGESTSQWTSRIQSKVPIKNGPAFLSCINGLYSIFQKAPRGSNQHGQDDFFRQHNQTLSHDIGDIENMIDDMCNILSKLLKVPENFVTHPRSGWSATRLFQSLRIQVLPLLLMVLKASFSTGYAEMQNRLLLGESQISTSTFSLMLKIIDCATQICAVMIEYLQHSSAEDQKIFSRPYLLMSHQIALFKAELQEASDTTTQRPACNRERRTLAIDKDRQVRQAREAKARRRQADAGTQTMLYLRSTQKLDVRRSGSGDSRHDSSSQRHKSGRPWSHDEDDAVLSLIRKFKPSYTIMAELLVGRTGEEVELRARELREVCRKRYEIDWGMIPPQWCYN